MNQRTRNARGTKEGLFHKLLKSYLASQDSTATTTSDKWPSLETLMQVGLDFQTNLLAQADAIDNKSGFILGSATLLIGVLSLWKSSVKSDPLPPYYVFVYLLAAAILLPLIILGLWKLLPKFQRIKDAQLWKSITEEKESPPVTLLIGSGGVFVVVGLTLVFTTVWVQALPAVVVGIYVFVAVPAFIAYSYRAYKITGDPIFLASTYLESPKEATQEVVVAGLLRSTRRNLDIIQSKLFFLRVALWSLGAELLVAAVVLWVIEIRH